VAWKEMMHRFLAMPLLGFSDDARGGVLRRSSWRGSPTMLVAGFSSDEEQTAARGGRESRHHVRVAVFVAFL
jgi:hypothetical protein